MLDLFTILTSGGIVLFQKSQSLHSAPIYLIDSVISDVFMQGRSSEKEFAKDGFTVKWTFANELGLIFVAVYQKILELTWVDDLLVTVKRAFVKAYGEALRAGDNTAVINDLNRIECHFGTWFDGKVQSYEGAKVCVLCGCANSKSGERNANAISVQELAAPLAAIQSETDPGITSDENLTVHSTSVTSPSIHLTTPAKSRLKKGKGKKGKNSPYQSRLPPSERYLMRSGDEARTVETKPKGKKARRWGEDGAYEGDADDTLDFSSAHESAATIPNIDIDNLIGTTHNSKFEIDEDDDEDDTDTKQSTRGWGIFSNFVGGKVLTEEDLKEPLEQMHQFLLAKNVASEVSHHLCESVEKSLVGQKTGNFQSKPFFLRERCLIVGIKNSVRKAIDDSLTRILTPTKSIDLLHDISTVRKQQRRPYTISFVGVNGVGKSTNLSKIAFKLLVNGHSILIAACDTFRSGAVEQLRKHVVNLNQWVERNGQGKGVKIQLFERGYGKDAADVAAHAVKFAEAEGFDVVLIDTAGRRHNDQALMGSLGKVPHGVNIN